MVAAWFGGLRGGLLATVLASLLMDYFYFEPVRSLFSFSHREDVLRLGVFVLVAVLISCSTRRSGGPRPSSTSRGASSSPRWTRSRRGSRSSTGAAGSSRSTRRG